MVDILQNIESENIRSQICQNQEAGRQALQNLKECKKLSAGAVFKSGWAWLGPEVLEAQLHRSKKKKEKELAKKKSNFQTQRIQVVSDSAEGADQFVAATEDSNGSPE